MEEDLVKFLKTNDGMYRGEGDEKHWNAYVIDQCNLYRKYERML